MIRIFQSTFMLLALAVVNCAMAQVQETAYVLSEIDSISTGDPDSQDLYIIDLTNGNLTLVAEIPNDAEDPVSGLDDVDGLAFDSAGTLFGADNDNERLVTINRNTGQVTVIGDFNGALNDVSNAGLSFNSAGTLFLSDGDAETLYTVNTATAALTEVGPFNEDITAIAFDSNDVLYAIDDTNNNLVTLNTANGSIDSTIGSLGFNPEDSQGLHFDRNDVLFMIDETDATGSALYRVNTSTGNATLVGTMPFDVEALAIFDIPVQFQERAIPTLTTWSLVAMVLILIVMSSWGLRRKLI